MIGYYNYTVILTYLGLASAVTGMVQAISGNYRAAVLLLLFCGLCDMFDGTVARTRKRTDEEISFGAHIDSLCDMVCFGAFPAILGYSLGVTRTVWGLIAMIAYTLAAVIRLAYFDVQEMTRLQNDEGRREYYTGLPVTCSSLVIPSLLALEAVAGLPVTRFFAVVLAIVAVLFISPFKTKKIYGKALFVVAALGAVVFFIIVFYGDRIACYTSSMAA